MSIVESCPSLQLIEAMKRTAVAVEGKDMWGFRRGMNHVVCVARVKQDSTGVIVVSDMKAAVNVGGGAQFALGFLSVLSDIFDVIILADGAGFDQQSTRIVDEMGFYRDAQTGLFVRLPQSLGRQAA
jgi:hypothetical protein